MAEKLGATDGVCRVTGGVFDAVEGGEVGGDPAGVEAEAGRAGGDQIGAWGLVVAGAGGAQEGAGDGGADGGGVGSGGVEAVPGLVGDLGDGAAAGVDCKEG